MIGPIAKLTHEDASRAQPDWAEIEQAYGKDPRRLTEIAADFGVSRQLIQARAAKGNWRRAGDAPGFDERDAGIDPDDVAKAEEASGARRKRMVARLFKALEEKMSQMETRIARGRAGGADESAADSEREARALSALAGLYAKLVELDEAGAKGAAKRRSEAAGDADQFREDLARRLKRLDREADA